MTTPTPCTSCGHQPRMAWAIHGNRILEADGTITKEDDVTAWTSCECDLDKEDKHED